MSEPPRSTDDETITTALSTLAARVAMLERWMHDAQRRQVGLAVTMLALITCVMWLLWR